MNIDRLMAQYEEGNIATLETAQHALRLVTEQNVNEVIEKARKFPEVYQRMRTDAIRWRNLDDEAWSKFVTVQSWNGPWNEEIKARVEAQNKLNTQLLRKGVEILSKKVIETENMTHRLICRKGFGYALVVENEQGEMFVYKTPDLGKMRLKIRQAEALFECRCQCEGFDG